MSSIHVKSFLQVCNLETVPAIEVDNSRQPQLTPVLPPARSKNHSQFNIKMTWIAQFQNKSLYKTYMHPLQHEIRKLTSGFCCFSEVDLRLLSHLFCVPDTPCFDFGLPGVLSIAFGGFLIGVLLIGALWFIKIKTGEHSIQFCLYRPNIAITFVQMDFTLRTTFCPKTLWQRKKAESCIGNIHQLLTWSIGCCICGWICVCLDWNALILLHSGYPTGLDMTSTAANLSGNEISFRSLNIFLSSRQALIGLLLLFLQDVLAQEENDNLCPPTHPLLRTVAPTPALEAPRARRPAAWHEVMTTLPTRGGQHLRSKSPIRV